MSIGATIQAHRKAHGWSQRRFAEELTRHGFAVDHTRASRVESGATDLRFSDILIVCKVLGCTPNDLAGIGNDLSRSNDTAKAVLESAIQKLTELKEQVTQ